MKKSILFVLLFVATAAMAQRQEINLDSWDFSRDSVNWKHVGVPHDWAICGPFDKKWDLQKVAIAQNGETEATEKSGRSGALPWIGKGYYRTQVHLPADCGHAELVFDGAMAEPVVTVNGQVAGGWKYGYNAFRIDITPYLRTETVTINPFCNMVEDQAIADITVSLQNLEESSRWYPGAGLYRPVKIVVTGEWGSKARIDDWSVFARTLSASNEKAVVRLSAKAVDATGGMNMMFVLRKPDGMFIASAVATIDENGDATADLEVTNPQLWSPERPFLYTVNANLSGMDGDGLLHIFDSYAFKTGIRTVKVSKERGFELNGQSRKIKGVCLHHDLGPLGAAVDKQALIRQVKILKEMGCDAIRTAHNMPSTMQMEVCDSMGMMVMAESFDMWIYPKCKNGYARFFKEWADKDITNLVLNHRNHPSIVMWSIGNEIPEQWDANEGVYWSRHLQDLIHQLDPTRPVTQGMDRADEALKSGFAQVMDVPGFNYRVHKYDNNIKQLPVGFLLGSETASTVSSRGVYKFPVVLSDNSQFASYSPNYDPTALEKADGQCSSYDVEWCPWSNLPDDDFLMMDDRDYTIGQFVWTGFDYLGEPTPYDEYWPSRSSYFGICDLAGLPKDRYYLYKSQWNKNDHTLHVLPHWTWPGREGQVTPVFVYTDYPEAELFINGKSQGRRKHDQTANQQTLPPAPPCMEGSSQGKAAELSTHPHSGGGTGGGLLLDRYRLIWNDVVYEPGELKVVGYDANGRAIDKIVKHTAGAPTRLFLNTEPILPEYADGKLRETYPKPTANRYELIFVTVSAADDDNNLVPDCNDELTFEVSGNGYFKAACNGDATSLESFTEPHMKLFNGQLVVVIGTNGGTAPVTLTVKDAAKGIEQSLTIPLATN